jgi:hypothetical protein
MSAPRLKAILVSTLGLEPELFLLTTGTFNLFVKDRITLRLSAVNSVQTRTHECASVCPRNLSKTKCSVTLLSTHCGHRISTRFSQRRTRGFTSLASPLEMWSFLGGDRTGLPPYMDRFLALAESGSQLLRKRPFGGSCENAKTLRGSLSPNADPVAGIDFRGFNALLNRCRIAYDRFTNPAATHCSRLIFYSMQTGSTQGQAWVSPLASFAELRTDVFTRV